MKSNGSTHHSAQYESPIPPRPPRERKNIRILLVEDHAVVREGFKLLLEREPGFSVVAQGTSGEDAIELASMYLPDVVLMDIQMPDLNGLQAARAILDRHPGMNIIILTMSDNDEFVQHAVQIGIQGYLLKYNASDEMIKAIKEVAINHNPYFSPAIQRKILNFQASKPLSKAGPTFENPRLTTRELEVLQLVADGKTSAEIANVLCVSVKTVQKHRQQMMDKLDIHDGIGLTRYAISKGLA